MAKKLIHPSDLSPLALLSEAEAAVHMAGITKIYGAGDGEVRALNGVNFTVFPHEYCAIMGPSGSGKSTLMNMIGCLDRPTDGVYELDGINVATLGEPELAEVRNRKIGFVFQQFHLLPHANAVENVMLPMIYAGIPAVERRDRAVAALTRVGLANRLNNRPNQLSGGQQQRVAIARAIVNEPVILLADEPTGALDSHTTEEVLELFAELNTSGITIIIVTHEADVAARTERTIWMRDGQVVEDGPSGAIAEKIVHHYHP